jgi:hypothetical protein
MSFDILDDLTPEEREELGHTLGVDPILLQSKIPTGRELDWWNTSDARDEARLILSLKK